MASPDVTTVGLILIRINGMYDLDAKAGRYSDRRANQTHMTGAGKKQATGFEDPTGSLDEVVPRSGAQNWRALRNFSMEWLDRETKKTVAYFEETNWTSIDGTMDLASANAARSVSWSANKCIKL